MNFLLEEFQLSEKALATFAAGMREMAIADDETHPNELALIDNLTQGLEVDEVFDSSTLTSSTLKENFMLMLALVAVADGKLLDSELEVLNKYATQLDIVIPVSDFIEVAALSLLAQYTDAEIEVLAPRLGKELGLSEDGILKAMSRS
jgi:uncharacterized tellurite resistance protein B-like protein